MSYEYLDKDGLNYLMNKIKPKSAVESGTDISLVTTGEKYHWNSLVENLGLTVSNGLLCVKYEGE